MHLTNDVSITWGNRDIDMTTVFHDRHIYVPSISCTRFVMFFSVLDDINVPNIDSCITDILRGCPVYPFKDHENHSCMFNVTTNP